MKAYKRFFLFGWHVDYPKGGLNDFLFSFDTKKDFEKAWEDAEEKHFYKDFYEIFDNENKKVIAELKEYEELEKYFNDYSLEHRKENNVNGIYVRVDLYGESCISDFWEGKIFGLNEDEIKNLFNDYKKSKQSEDSLDRFLQRNNVKFERIIFEVNINF